MTGPGSRPGDAAARYTSYAFRQRCSSPQTSFDSINSLSDTDHSSSISTTANDEGPAAAAPLSKHRVAPRTVSPSPNLLGPRISPYIARGLNGGYENDPDAPVYGLGDKRVTCHVNRLDILRLYPNLWTTMDFRDKSPQHR